MMTAPIRIYWAGGLRKDDLIVSLTGFNLDATETAEEVRKRFGCFVGGEHEGETLARLLTLLEKYEALLASHSPIPPCISTANQK